MSSVHQVFLAVIRRFFKANFKKSIVLSYDIKNYRYNMEREYPQKMFWLFVLTNFLFHFFYLSVPGIILCIVGIWIKTCLYIGCAVLSLNLILSIVEQSRIRNAAVSHSENPEFNELMDAFCSPDGLQAVGKVLDEKIKSTPDDESEKGKDQ